MSRAPRLTSQDIEHMKMLKKQGYTNRHIAEIFNVAKSTVWDNIYSEKGNKIELPPFRKIQIAIEVIKVRKQQGKNSLEVANEFEIPLGEVNYIWGTLTRV